eukprot:231523-Alexandrium_andersonii.AAC.1
MQHIRRWRRSISTGPQRFTLEAREQTHFYRSGRAIRAPYKTFIRTRAAGRYNVPCGRFPPHSNTYSSVPERKGVGALQR